MDRAYEGNETWWVAQSLAFELVVPRRRRGWSTLGSYDTEPYDGRNEIDRLFGRIERYAPHETPNARQRNQRRNHAHE